MIQTLQEFIDSYAGEKLVEKDINTDANNKNFTVTQDIINAAVSAAKNAGIENPVFPAAEKMHWDALVVKDTANTDQIAMVGRIKTKGISTYLLYYKERLYCYESKDVISEGNVSRSNIDNYLPDGINTSTLHVFHRTDNDVSVIIQIQLLTEILVKQGLGITVIAFPCEFQNQPAAEPVGAAFIAAEQMVPAAAAGGLVLPVDAVGNGAGAGDDVDAGPAQQRAAVRILGVVVDVVGKAGKLFGNDPFDFQIVCFRIGVSRRADGNFQNVCSMKSGRRRTSALI